MSDNFVSLASPQLTCHMHTEEKPYIYEMPIKVRDYEVDSQGIVNNANYLHYLEHTRHEFCEARGFTFRDMQQQGIDPRGCQNRNRIPHPLKARGIDDKQIVD